MFSKLIGSVMAAIFAFFDAQEIREEIDDFLDKIEAKLAAKPDGIKKTALQNAIGLGRSILGIPDDIGGDED